jgi:hypothetical protein
VRPPLFRDELRRARHFVSNARKIGYENMDKSVKDGGNQIEYEDEDPRVLELYERSVLVTESRRGWANWWRGRWGAIMMRRRTFIATVVGPSALVLAAASAQP